MSLIGMFHEATAFDGLTVEVAALVESIIDKSRIGQVQKRLRSSLLTYW